MADPRLNRMLETLDTTFDAAVARAEDEAASDLAFSLLQGRALLDLVVRNGPWDLYLGEARRVPVTLVGRDFIAGGRPPTALVPAANAVLLRAPDGEPPRASDDGLVEELRGLAGFRAVVEVVTTGAVLRGSLTHVGPDHLALHTGVSEAMIALNAISQVTLIEVGEGSD